MSAPQSKESIVEALESVLRDVSQFSSNITEDQFFGSTQSEKWTICENLDHLFRSNKPVAKALALPKISFLPFGKSDDGSRSYEKLVEFYQSKLNAGGKATGRYVPAGKNESPEKAEVEAGYQQSGEKLISNLQSWDEKDLDRYRMPHPLLGKLTVREMLFFTIYHNQHHLKNMRTIAEQI